MQNGKQATHQDSRNAGQDSSISSSSKGCEEKDRKASDQGDGDSQQKNEKNNGIQIPEKAEFLMLDAGNDHADKISKRQGTCQFCTSSFAQGSPL